LPYVVGLRPSKGSWAPIEDAHTPQEAAQRLQWNGVDDPQDWTPVVRRFRDGHTQTWWAAELTLAGYGPDKPTRLVVATTDPATLPATSSWYLATNLPRPGAAATAEWPVEPADLAEIVRLYGLRNWVEQSYKQAKHQLGWADFQVRQDAAIRRHWELVCCAFAFCWWVRCRQPAPAVACRADLPPAGSDAPGAARTPGRNVVSAEEPAAGGKSNHSRRRTAFQRRNGTGGDRLVAPGPAPGPWLADPLVFPLALLASVERLAPTTVTPGLARCGG